MPSCPQKPSPKSGKKRKGVKADFPYNSRGISLHSIAGKVLARVMLYRLVSHISEDILPESQCGFRRDRSTTDMIFVVRQVQEECRKHHEDLYVAFIDLTKAFDTINRKLLWGLLGKLGVPPKFLNILKHLRNPPLLM